jgi:hypothetical protein
VNPNGRTIRQCLKTFTRAVPQTLLPPPQRGHRNLLRSALALSRRRQQRRDLPQHAGKHPQSAGTKNELFQVFDSASNSPQKVKLQGIATRR